MFCSCKVKNTHPQPDALLIAVQCNHNSDKGMMVSDDGRCALICNCAFPRPECFLFLVLLCIALLKWSVEESLVFNCCSIIQIARRSDVCCLKRHVAAVPTGRWESVGAACREGLISAIDQSYIPLMSTCHLSAVCPQRNVLCPSDVLSTLWTDWHVIIVLDCILSSLLFFQWGGVISGVLPVDIPLQNWDIRHTGNKRCPHGFIEKKINLLSWSKKNNTFLLSANMYLLFPFVHILWCEENWEQFVELKEGCWNSSISYSVDWHCFQNEGPLKDWAWEV